MEATFYFDPSCPWTWRTSRWLVAAASQRNVTVRWRPFSIGILNEGRELPAKYAKPMAAAARALRLVAALAEAGRDEDAGRFYAELGARTHDAGAELTDAAVGEAAEAAGVADAAGALDDAGWDAAVRRSHDTAFGSAGPDVGSPVLALDGAARALHGPIIAEVPPAQEAAALWDAVVPLLRSETFFEVKRGRR
ncbi:MAG TPA: DsbA family protein [Pilimelia sp.]|nr:DsbA family protein [Pilimelia sp.]